MILDVEYPADQQETRDTDESEINLITDDTKDILQEIEFLMSKVEIIQNDFHQAIKSSLNPDALSSNHSAQSPGQSPRVECPDTPTTPQREQDLKFQAKKFEELVQISKLVHKEFIKQN